jgi:hypothetical protein
VRLLGHSGARSLLVAFLVASLVNVPALAADRPLGMIVLARSAHLGDQEALAGTNVYSGDTLEVVDGDGLVRLKLGLDQLYLAGYGSRAMLTQLDRGVRATLLSGTLGLSSAPGKMEIETALAIIRPADGARAFGQVTLTGPNQMTVAAYSGALVLEGNGSKQTIPAGEAYRVTLVPDDTAAAVQDQQQGPPGGASNQHYTVYSTGKGKLILELIIIGGAAIGSYFLYRHFTHSCSDPDC